MKNFIPLILAVLLGLAAVLAVGRLLKARRKAEEATSSVVAAARNVNMGSVLTSDSVMQKTIPLSAKPAQAILWSRHEITIGQKALRPISQGDYVLLTDIGLSRSMGDIVGEGEWAVTLSLPSGGLSRVIQPGDEVAIIGTFTIKTRIESPDLSAEARIVSKEATLVLFPRVRVLDVAGQESAMEMGSEIIVALPPRQAQVLISAQRRADLVLALRRPGDESTISRADAGMVDEDTFNKLLEGLDAVTMPDIPGMVGETVKMKVKEVNKP